MTKFITYGPYTQVKLVKLDKQFWQRAREPLAAWLLHLWDAGMDRVMLLAQEIRKKKVGRSHSAAIPETKVTE
jgi:hypothetical protein